MRRRMKGAVVVIAMLTALVPVTAANASDGGDDDDQLHGIVESLPATTGFIGDWLVSGTTVHVTSTTEIDAEDGVIAVGASVEVEGTVGADGSITATQIDVENDAEDDEFGEVDLHGTVETLPATVGFIGDWKVCGHHGPCDLRHGDRDRGRFARRRGVRRGGGPGRGGRLDHRIEGRGERRPG